MTLENRFFLPVLRMGHNAKRETQELIGGKANPSEGRRLKEFEDKLNP